MKHYLKHKYINQKNNGEFAYLNHTKNGLTLGNNIQNHESLTKFSLLEIEEIKAKNKTNLVDYEIIPVEEI